MNTFNVLYAIDSNYINYLLVSLYSLLENNTSIKIIVHIVCDKFDIENYKTIESIIRRFENANIYFYPFQEIAKVIEEYNIPNWRGTQIANARLFFTNYIKNVQQLLYLDADTIIVDSLSKLQTYEGALHMVQDSMPKDYWQNLEVPLKQYCNSGVILFNVDKWKEKNCDKKINEILKRNLSYTFPDQDIINMALHEEIQLLPPEYNLLSTDSYYNPILLWRYYKRQNVERYSKEQVKRAKKSPIIFHSTPFHSLNPLVPNNIHPYSKNYQDYFYKIFGEINQEATQEAWNPLLFKLYLYSSLYCPKTVRSTVKKLIKKS